MECIHSQVGVSVVDSNGTILPCCKFTDIGNLPTIFDIDSLNNLHQSYPYHKIKHDLNNGKWPTGCQTCKVAEQSGTGSRRVWSNKFYKEHNLLHPPAIQDLEIALDYTCNMRCQICNPSASSKWGTSAKLLQDLDSAGIDYMKNSHYRNYQDRMKLILSNTDLSQARHIKIEGGEPFYAKHLSWFIDKLHQEVLNPDKLFLNITTNGSVYPTQQVIRQLEYFRNSGISFSLDGIGKLAENTRWGVSWETIDRTIQSFSKTDINLYASCTVSILNFNKLQALQDYLKHYNIKVSFNELTFPKHLSIYQLPLSVREQFVTGNSELDRILTADITINNQLTTTRDYIDIMDRHQKTDFRSVNRYVWEIINGLVKINRKHTALST